jgi:hypothetical protein
MKLCVQVDFSERFCLNVQDATLKFLSFQQFCIIIHLSLLVLWWWKFIRLCFRWLITRRVLYQYYNRWSVRQIEEIFPNFWASSYLFWLSYSTVQAEIPISESMSLNWTIQGRWSAIFLWPICALRSFRNDLDWVAVAFFHHVPWQGRVRWLRRFH